MTGDLKELLHRSEIMMIDDTHDVENNVKYNLNHIFSFYFIFFYNMSRDLRVHTTCVHSNSTMHTRDVGRGVMHSIRPINELGISITHRSRERVI